MIVANPGELLDAPAEFQEMVRKIVRSHAINELASAWIYDEPAIALAPSPFWKWQTCRIAMEEYGHYLKFAKMGRAIGIEDADMIPGGAKPSLTIIGEKLGSWTEYCVFKMVADMAEVILVEDLFECSYAPLAKAARETMPEERFHVSFGERACAGLDRAEVQFEVDRLLPKAPAFFGAPNSKNNGLYRKWGIKQRTNEAMAADYLALVRRRLERLGLTVPNLKAG